MKLPAVAIAAAFACGVALGLRPVFSVRASSPIFLCSLFTATACLILMGLLLIRFQRLVPAAFASAAAWTLLGIFGVTVAQQPRAQDHVLRLVDEHRIELHTPLWWHGTLRDEPARLPWGYGYEIQLTGVEYQSALLPAGGGMRVSFTTLPGRQELPRFHAGDEVTVLVQARRPQVFRDDGAFDRRSYLAQQNIDLTATLRAPELIERASTGRRTAGAVLMRTRGRLREEIDEMFDARPEVGAILRAMLLGDRTFVDRDAAADFQKTGVFHVLVVAGLHVGALAAFWFWVGNRLRLAMIWKVVLTLLFLFAYVAVVEQRPPVLRAGLMVGIVVTGGFFYRRLDLLNSAAIAALVLLIAQPLAIGESSFQLTFVAIGCIAGLALPYLEKTSQPYAKALRGWRDVTRDAVHEPKAAQFRIDLRTGARWISSRPPRRLAASVENILVAALAVSFRTWELFVLTIVLQFGMLPLMARDFHRIALSAPLANLGAVALTSVVVPLGFLTLGSALVFPAVGRIVAAPLGWATELLVKIVHWFAHFPHSSYRIPGPPAWLIAMMFFLAALLAVAMRLQYSWRRQARLLSGAGLLGCCLTVAAFPFAPKQSAGKLEVTVLDVGQGDSLLVVSPGGRTLLIDGGGAFGGFPGHEEHNAIDPGEEAVSPYLWSRGYQRLDVVALTHGHQDHLGGLTAVLQNFRVGELWIGREVASPGMANLEKLAREEEIPVEHETRGKKFAWDGVEGEFLWPRISSSEPSLSAKNNDSLVLRLRFRNRTFMLPGDAEKEAEREILAENTGDELAADVLKIGHHGSKNSTLPGFLAAVKPRLAIISAGEDNPYGHPSPELVERLEGARTRILRTDRDGAVQVLTDGERMEIACFVACPDAESETSRQAQAPDHQEDDQQQ